MIGVIAAAWSQIVFGYLFELLKGVGFAFEAWRTAAARPRDTTHSLLATDGCFSKLEVLSCKLSLN